MRDESDFCLSRRAATYFRVATILALTCAASACATQHHVVHEWTAQGYLSPAPTGEPEIIGVYDNEDDCVAAGEAWMSRQVVGNPVYADCLPVDHD
ncbi:hypothetical protein ACFOOP_15515 [Marinicaulis aureus]|uniref:Lipoprotein n=1 Tax=Hyphococcus aureus TaxID=2666033 RepID=A0ABW1KXT4_9PROT